MQNRNLKRKEPQMAYVEKNGVPEPGWSDRVDSPEIAAAIAKNRKAAFKWGVVTCIIALVAPTVISKFAPDAVKPEIGRAHV